MSCRTESKTINGREFSVTQWPVETAMLRQLIFMKTFGPSVAKLVNVFMEAESTKPKGGEVDESKLLSSGVSSIGPIIQQLFSSSNPQELMAFIKECLIDVACDGKKMTSSSISSTFSADQLMEMYQVFWFVIVVNFGNFIPGKLVDTIKAKLPSL